MLNSNCFFIYIFFVFSTLFSPARNSTELTRWIFEICHDPKQWHHHFTRLQSINDNSAVVFRTKTMALPANLRNSHINSVGCHGKYWEIREKKVRPKFDWHEIVFRLKWWQTLFPFCLIWHQMRFTGHSNDDFIIVRIYPNRFRLYLMRLFSRCRHEDNGNFKPFLAAINRRYRSDCHKSIEIADAVYGGCWISVQYFRYNVICMVVNALLSLFNCTNVQMMRNTPSRKLPPWFGYI